MPDKKSSVNLLNSIADIMEFKSDNPFKIGAFRNGAIVISRLEGDFQNIIEEKKLNEIKGIGKGLQAVIYEYFEKGESELLNSLKKEIPEGIEELLKIRGLGAKKIKQLYDKLEIANIGELEQACKENRIMLLKGFGETTQKKILEEINKLKIYSKFVRLNVGNKLAEEILNKLRNLNSIQKVELSGELRRGAEVVSAIDYVSLISDEAKFFVELKKVFSYKTDLNKILLDVEYAIPVTVHFVKTESEFASVLLRTTGSDYFLSQLNLIENNFEGETEEEIFESINHEYVIPEMREKEYFEADVSFRENSNLTVKEFKGMLHFHTDYSDGKNTFSEMISAAKEFGYSFAVVCDHSKTAFYANGLTEERVIQQKEDVQKISEGLNFPVLQGIESDILQNGELDFSTDFLNNFNFIVASVHSRFNMLEAEMTKRIIKAIENEHTDVLGHPSGRLLLAREPYKFEIKKIIDACAANRVAIELNSNPQRLDIDWRMIYYAREKGCLFSINQDAHSIDELDLLQYGIKMGRKGGLQKEEVINCFEFDKFKKFLKRKITNRLVK
jgi:DNA polymerase (family 10)